MNDTTTQAPDVEATEQEPQARTLPRVSVTPLRPGRRDLWQIPTAIGAIGLLVLGILLWKSGQDPTDFHGALDTVERYLEQQEPEPAIDILNGPVLAHLNDPAVDTAVLARFYALRADALFLRQKQAGLDVEANHVHVLRNYEQSLRHTSEPLSSVRLARKAETLFALGRYDDAISQARKLPETETGRRHELLKQIVDLGMDASASGAERARALDVLAELRNDPQLTDEDRVWTIVRQSRISLRAGYPEEALRRVLPEIQRLQSRLTPEGAELFVVLGEAYLELGHIEEARKHLERASELLPGMTEAAARAQVLLARVDRATEEIESARDRYALVASSFPESGVGTEAWLGMGETEAELGRPEESLEAYARAVDTMSRVRSELVSVERAASSLAQRHRERYERGDYETSLRYALLVERLYLNGDPPPADVLRLADTHLQLAEKLLDGAARRPDGMLDLSETDPNLLERARRHFADAGSNFARHARLALLGDPEASADSLWYAADAYDRAGDLEQAADLFAEYVEVRHDDPREVEGRFRLARTFQARGDYATAKQIFEEIITENPTSTEAYRSYVPLAQCAMLNHESPDFQLAEDRLLQVVGGEIFEPTAPEFRSGLIELGQMYRRLGRYPEAIQRLEEALDRYPEHAADSSFLFHLADAYRLSAAEIGERLGTAMPESERQELRGIRELRLGRSLELYERTRQLLEDKDARRLTDLERIMLRNATFYRGDCAYDLGEHFADFPDIASGHFEEAIRYYDAAAQRYSQDPASLVAMIQIVNCYAALQKWREVRTAHERARARLAELPQESWEGAEAPMDRRYWERWLETSVALDEMASATER